jgi:hypothetical protein
MPMKRNVRKAMEAPEPLVQEPVVDEKKEAKRLAREAFVERKMGPRGAMRRYEKCQSLRMNVTLSAESE